MAFTYSALSLFIKEPVMTPKLPKSTRLRGADEEINFAHQRKDKKNIKDFSKGMRDSIQINICTNFWGNLL